MIGRSIRVIIPADHQHEEDNVFARIRAGERVAHFETKRQRKDGSLVPISLSVSPVRDARGVVIGESKIARDITDQMSTAEALRQSIAVKNEFLSLVSHELRTHIGTIVGNGQLLLRRGDRLGEKARIQALQDVVTESQRLQRIVENLLILTRLSSTAELLLAPIDLGDLVRETTELAQRRAPHRTIEARIEQTARISGDVTLLTMAVQNLLSNALKYSPGDSPVEVVLQLNLAGRPELHVLDRGPEIDTPDVERIFDAFFRSSATSARVEGMGLGLAVSRKALEAQGGSLRYEQRAGGSSDFYFSLPAGTEAKP